MRSLSIIGEKEGISQNALDDFAKFFSSLCLLLNSHVCALVYLDGTSRGRGCINLKTLYCSVGSSHSCNHESFKNHSWNECGLNSRARQDSIRTFVDSSHVDIVCLLETKVAAVPRQTILASLDSDFNNFVELPADGASGGILIAWQHGLGLAAASSFFFLEQRRRTWRHFIKVEKGYIGLRDPTHTPHNLDTKFQTLRRKNRNNQTALRAS